MTNFKKTTIMKNLIVILFCILTSFAFSQTKDSTERATNASENFKSLKRVPKSKSTPLTKNTLKTTAVTPMGMTKVKLPKKSHRHSRTFTVPSKEKPADPPTAEKTRQTLQITSHTDGQNIGITTQILGIGEPGLQIKVSLYAFAEVTPKKQSPWEAFKMITLPTSTYSEVKKILTQKTGSSIKERTFNTYDVTIDENGKWYIPPLASFGDPNWIGNAFIPFAWVVVATVENPNYQDGNYVNIRLGVKL